MNDVIDSSLGSFSSTSAVDALPGQVGQTRRPFSGSRLDRDRHGHHHRLMGGIHPLSDLADTRRQPSAARPRRTPLLGHEPHQRGRHRADVADCRIQSSRRVRISRHVGRRRCTGHPARRPHRLCRNRTRAAPVVADRVPDRCAGRHRPGHRAERHRHQPCDSLCGNAVTGVRQHLRRVQIPYRRTAADRFRRWQPDGGMDDMPMAVIPRRRVRHRRQTAAQCAEPAADRPSNWWSAPCWARRPVSSP